jgi:hypothetical protein
MGRINSIISATGDDTKFNSTMKAALFQTGLTWDEEFGKLTDLLTKNGTIPNYTSRPLQELQTDSFVWSQRLSMSIATSLYQVSETCFRWLSGYDNPATIKPQTFTGTAELSDSITTAIDQFQYNYSYVAAASGPFDLSLVRQAKV